MSNSPDQSAEPSSEQRPAEPAAVETSAPTAAEQTPSAPAKRRGPYWKTLVGLLILAAVLQGVFWYLADGDSSAEMLSTIIVWMAVALLVMLWWTFLSGTRARTRLVGWGVIAAAVIAFVALFRLEGFSGDFIPQFALRSAPTADQRAVEYFEAQPASETSAPEVDELTISPDDWPQFRGPNRDGVVQAGDIRRDWDANPPKLLWKHVVGPAWSSFAVVGNRAYTQEQRGDDEAVVCYDVETGTQIWLHTDRARFSEVMGGDGPRATPTVRESRLYALGATGILNCLDPMTGDVLWTTNILEDAGVDSATENLPWAMAGSPLVFDEMVVVNPGGSDDSALAAYDRKTGEKKWSGGSRRAGYASPVLAVIDGVQQILVFGGDGLSGHDASNGTELWFYEWVTQEGINVAEPIVTEDGGVFISSGYNVGSALLDVTRDGDDWSVEPRWERENKFKLKFNAGVLKDNHVYGLDEGILACFDLDDGEHAWKRGRYKFGQVLLVDDVLLVTSEWGKVALVEATPEAYREIASFDAVEGKTWNFPALAHGRLLVRSDREAACYDVSPVTTTASKD